MDTDIAGTDSSLFQSKSEALILRQLRLEIVRRKFGRMGQLEGWVRAGYRRYWNSDELRIVVHESDWILMYSLRIYSTTITSGLLLSSLTNAFFEDAMWLEPRGTISKCWHVRVLSATVHVSWKFERNGLVSCRSCSSLLVLMFMENEI